MKENDILSKIHRFTDKYWKSTMSIQLLRNNTNTDADMDSYKKELRRHKLRNAGIAAAVFAVAVLCLLGLRFSLSRRTFSSYEVVQSYERADTMTTQYTEFLKYVLKYSKDGIACVNSQNQNVWNQTYNMQNPVVDVCQGSVALAEENGTEAMIFDESGLQGSIQTTLPIRQISVSSQGVLAVLMEDGDAMRLNLYNKKGEELVSSKFELQDTGYPLKMSLCADATKLAVTFLQVQGGAVNTSLAFYNFDSVGENYGDHMVAAQEVSGVMPEVKYADGTHCFAVGTHSLFVFSGQQIPEMTAEVAMEKEIKSVFYSSENIGVVVEGEELPYALQVYDLQGKMKFETEFDLDYRTLKFSGDNILIYDEFDCVMMNMSGNIFFTAAFDESISNLYTMSGNSYYIVMHASRTDRIRLR